MMRPLLHVLVINWNGLEHLRECFESLLAGDYEPVRFVLIDNGSTDESVGFVRDHFGSDPRVEIVQLPANLGWSRGNNVGIARAIEANADYVFLLNNDTVTAPDALSRLVETAEGRPEIGALAPKMLFYDNPAILNSMGLECSMIASSWDLGIGRLDGPRWEKASPVIGVCGGAAFLRVEALRRTGLLPSDFDIYLDDLDLSLRIWNAGYEVRSCPESRVRHKFGATMGAGKQYRRKYYLNTRNRLYILSRNFPALQWLPVMAAYGVGEARAIGRALLDREPWRAAAHVRAWGAGLGYLPRAVRERRRRRRAGQGACRFWHLVRKDCMFFRGTEFPVDGWYAERAFRGKKTRPMSARARTDVAPGRLRVTLVNCYPRLGNACVDVSLNGQPVALLETPDSPQTVLDVPSGVLALKARRIFEAEETGELVDMGGWITIERL